MSTDEPAKSLQVGAIFAKDFRITGRLGEGGMGVVYAAEQISTSKRRALKLMHTGMTHDPKLRERFLQEAHAAAQIESDHVAEVVAAGIDEPTSIPWLAMELLRGKTLEQRVRTEGPLAPRDLLELGTQMRHALAQAHARGIVHRDLKPENLFVCEPRRAGAVFTLKVLDFGIAKWVQEAKNIGNSQILGSPLWMAPEQWRPNAPIRASTDVWAIGLVMFYALTGQMYWRTASSGDIGRVIVEVIQDPLAPPSERAQQLGLSAEVPPGFDDWFLSCLMRDPDARPQDADVALGAFEELFDGARRSIRKVSFRDTGPREVRRIPTPAVAPRSVVRETDVTRPLHVASERPATTIWRAVARPLLDHERITTVLTALGPVVIDTVAVDPALAGVTENLRLDRIALRTGATDRAAYDQARAAIARAAERLEVAQPDLYAREDLHAPLRVEPTAGFAITLGPALATLPPPVTTFLCAMAVLSFRPQLRLHVLMPDVVQLRRLVSAAMDIARGRATKGARDMWASVLRGQITPGSSLAATLTAHHDACTDDALRAWRNATDIVFARTGLVATGSLDAAEQALSVEAPLPVSPSKQLVLGDLAAWMATDDFKSARAAWERDAAR